MHFIRDLVHDRTIDLQLCPSSEQTVDIFMKTFTRQKFQDFVGLSWSEEHSCLAASFSSFDALSFEGGFVPMWFSLFPHFYSVFISCIVHEYLIWPSCWDSFLLHSDVHGGCWRNYYFRHTSSVGVN
jgi:hypothetical protein